MWNILGLKSGNSVSGKKVLERCMLYNVEQKCKNST